METQHLEAFLVLAEELHFGRAAERLHMAQPTLSQQLQRLERDVGTKLVGRSSRTVLLTPAGHAFRPQAASIIEQLRSASRAALAAADGRAGTVRVGFNYPAGSIVLPGVVTSLESRHPEIELNLRELRTGPQLQALRTGRLDAALVYGAPRHASFQSLFLLDVPIVAVVGKQHPWAARTEADFAELADEACLLFEREQSPAMYDTLLECAEERGISLTVADVVDDPLATAILASVRRVIAFASAPRAMALSLAGAAGRARVIELHNPTPSLPLHLVWRHQPGPLVETFVEAVRDWRARDQRSPERTKALTMYR